MSNLIINTFLNFSFEKFILILFKWSIVYLPLLFSCNSYMFDIDLTCPSSFVIYLFFIGRSSIQYVIYRDMYVSNLFNEANNITTLFSISDYTACHFVILCFPLMPLYLLRIHIFIHVKMNANGYFP